MEMAPSPEGTGGLRAAQRVPDGDFFAAANEFRCEGRAFDLTGSVAAGPFGCPERYLDPTIPAAAPQGDPSVRPNGDIRQRTPYQETRAEEPVAQAHLADLARSAPARGAAVYGIS